MMTLEELNSRLTFEDYKKEIDLISERNSVELGLYYIIEYILRASKRDEFNIINVSSRRRWESDDYKRYISNSGFPDMLMLVNNTDVPFGAVEVKYPTKSYILDSYIEQIRLHVEKFEKVIYTDGLEWRIYNGNFDNPMIYHLIELNDTGEKVWKSNWDELIRALKHFFDEIYDTELTLKENN